MKKFGMYSLMVAAVLLTGCSQKNVEMDSSSKKDTNMQQKSTGTDSKLDTMSDANMAENNNAMETETVGNGNYLTVSGKKVFVDNLYFAFDKYNLTDEMRETSKSNATKLSSLSTNVKVKLEGNCDEWGTDEYNYALGLKRAKAAKDALVADGIPSSSITLVSFGESNPVCTDKNAACWQKNRRSEHKLVK